MASSTWSSLISTASTILAADNNGLTSLDSTVTPVDDSTAVDNAAAIAPTIGRGLLTVALIALCVVTVCGNTLVVLAVLTTRRLRTVTNCFVTSLAMADWLVGLLLMPPAVAVHQLGGEWPLGWWLCDIWIALDVLLCTASILSLCAISIDRYLVVWQPLNYSRGLRTKRLALKMVLVVWVIALTISCPPLLGWYDESLRGPPECHYYHNAGYVIFSAMGSFFIPMAVMVYVYVRISCVLAQRHDDMRDIEMHQRAQQRVVINALATVVVVRQHQLITHHVHHQHQHHQHEHSTSMSHRKATQTLSIVVGGFIVCWLPFFVYYLATPFLPAALVSGTVTNCLTWLGWFNSAVNPFIYAFYSTDLRAAIRRLTFQRP